MLDKKVKGWEQVISCAQIMRFPAFSELHDCSDKKSHIYSKVKYCAKMKTTQLTK